MPPVHRISCKDAKNAIVAFDSYENISVKYMMHQRQSKKGRLVQIVCHANIIIAMNKDLCLAKQKNKLNVELREKATEKLTMLQKMLIF